LYETDLKYAEVGSATSGRMGKTLTEFTLMNQLLKMLNRWKTTSGILFLIMLISNNTQEEIVGTWVAEGSSFENRWVYHAENTLTTYYKNNVYKTYNWSIREVSTPSGLTKRELVLINIENPDDQKNFIIDTLTEERLILVYNTGVGLSRNTYFRQ
jgi:hypothetical protein